MKIFRFNSLLVCFLLISNFVFCQQKNDTTSLPYQFLFRHFTDGMVVLKDGQKFNVKLNYDTSTDQMQFVGTDNVIMNLAEPEKISMVAIGKRNFFYIREFFTELINDGPVSLYLRVHEKRIAQQIGGYGGISPTSSIEAVTSLTTSDGNSNTLKRNELVDYKTEYVFSVMTKGKIKIVSTQNELLKCFPSHKDLLKQEMDKQNTKLDSIDSVKKIIEWINANGIKD